MVAPIVTFFSPIITFLPSDSNTALWNSPSRNCSAKGFLVINQRDPTISLSVEKRSLGPPLSLFFKTLFSLNYLTPTTSGANYSSHFQIIRCTLYNSPPSSNTPESQGSSYSANATITWNNEQSRAQPLPSVFLHL